MDASTLWQEIHHQGDHVAVAVVRRLLVVRAGDDDARPVHRRSPHGEAAVLVRELHQPGGADRPQQRVEIVARALEVVGAERHVADHCAASPSAAGQSPTRLPVSVRVSA